MNSSVWLLYGAVKKNHTSWALVTVSLILATQEAEIRRTAIQNQPRQIVYKTLS
jgi:hypothetical protein